jgi:hypothetical protein
MLTMDTYPHYDVYNVIMPHVEHAGRGDAAWRM